jgi:tetratricopeptide (TPR) repeat protein
MLRVLNRKAWLAPVLLVTLVGCLGGPAAPVREAPPPVVTAPAPTQPDQVLLEDALRGRSLSHAEVAGLSDRLLTEGNPALHDEKTMARLEILLLKALKSPDKAKRAVLLRNLGILHYQQNKFKKARQELQNSNELNPRDPRTHFYLARLFVQQGEIYQRQGKKKLSRQQFKRATIEMEQAHKLAPGNSTYKQDPKQALRHEHGK